MVALADFDKSRVRYHLAYSEAVPDGDRALLEDRMDNVADSYTIGQIQARLLRCDAASGETALGGQQIAPTSTRTLLGDVNRTDQLFSVEDIKTRRAAYLYETEQLSLEIGAPNYRNPESWQNLHLRMAGRIPRIPAPVDTIINLSIYSDIYLYYA